MKSEGKAVRLRIATDPSGDDVVPTAQERARIEAEHARGEAQAKRAAEARVREPEALVAKLQSR